MASDYDSPRAANVHEVYTAERPVFLSRQEVQNIHTKLARLDEKLDALLSDRSKVREIEDEIVELKLFRAQVKTWGIVAGGLWSLILTLISIKVAW